MKRKSQLNREPGRKKSSEWEIRKTCYESMVFKMLIGFQTAWESKLKLSFKRMGSCAGLCHSCPFLCRRAWKICHLKRMAIKTVPWFPFNPTSINNIFWCLLATSSVGGGGWGVLWAGGHLKDEMVSTISWDLGQREQILLILNVPH